MSEVINRGTGLLLIEVINSNPNGDPDRDSDPRVRQDRHGEISPVSFKHKIREMVDNKQSPLWLELQEELALDPAAHEILESKNTRRADVPAEASCILDRYWDARVFGATFLEEKPKRTFIRTGVVQFGLGVSLSPISIERLTTTKVLPVEKDKSRGMAPLGFRIVPYGVYAMPFFVNATAATQTNCTKTDIDLLLRLIPFAYTQSASYVRSQVNIRHAFYLEHKRARGTFNDFEAIEMLTPTKLINSDSPATAWKDYDLQRLHDNILALNEKLREKASPLVDLMDHMGL